MVDEEGEEGESGLVPQGPQKSDSSEADIASVITQVNTYETSAKPTSFSVATPVKRPSEEPWKAKLKALLCCFAPSSGGYSKHTCENNFLAPGLIRERGGHLIGPKHTSDLDKKTLVLDLDETLVHSSFKPIPNPDWIVPVEIEGRVVDVYVLKRPCLDLFMENVGSRFEVVVFTASLGKYADPLLDWLDDKHVVKWRLFREACVPWEGNYVKDLSFLGRDLATTIIVDNSPHSYIFQPDNALPISTFLDDMTDSGLLGLLPILDRLEVAGDVRTVLTGQQ